MKLLISLLVSLSFILLVQVVNMMINGHRDRKGALKKMFKTLNEQEIKSAPKRSIKPKQYIRLFIPIGVGVFIFSIIFFRNLNSAIVLTLIASVYPYYLTKQRKRKMKKLLNYQLRDALNALSASLRAGSSLNNALIRTYDDLCRIYASEKHKPIVDAFENIAYELDLMVPVEEVLINFKNKADLEDVNDFVNVTLMTRRQGGNLNEVISRITEIISDRIEVEHEIQTLVSGKQYEAKILTVLPIVLVILLTYMSPDYMSPMYNTTLGKGLMILASVLLGINYILGKKIIEIEV